MISFRPKTGINPHTAAFALTVLAIVLIAAGVSTRAQAQTPVAFPAPTTFTAAYCSSYPCANSVTAAATGDFNGDGKLDVLTLDGSNLNVILGKGDGTFQAPISLNVSATDIFWEAIATGDFTSSHLLDVAVWAVNANTGNSELHIFLGNGAGSLTYNATYSAPNSGNTNPGPNNLVAMDVNGDGKIDIVAMTPYNGVFVFLGNGDGTFQAPIANTTVCTNAIGNCESMAVGDLNGDGKPDLAFDSNDTTGGGISILLNTGSGTFGSAAYYPVAISGVFAGAGIAIGDVNGDKKPDVVVGSAGGATAIVYLNQGSGTFKVGGTVGSVALYATNNLVLADINNDKKLDIVVPDGFGDVYTFYGTGKGTFTTGQVYPLQSCNDCSNFLVVLGDFNGDGALDLLDTDGFFTNTVSLGRGDGTFQTAQSFPFALEVQYQNIAVADFNGDGIPDVAAQGPTSGSLAVVLGAQHGTLTAKQLITSVCTNTFTYGIAAGDVNGDGKADLVAVFGGGSDSCNHEVAVLLGLGTGKFKKAVFYPTGAGTNAQEEEVYLVDVNGDGKLDIVIANSDGTLSVLLNKGSGTYTTEALVPAVANLFYQESLTFADFNGDGKMDIALTSRGAYSTVWVLPGNGNGTFGTPVQTQTSYVVDAAVAGDFNKDGKQDLLATVNGIPNCGSGAQFLQGNGNGTFTAGTINCVGGGAFSNAPVAADLNGDGNLDVIIPYSAGNFEFGPALLQGNGNGTFTPTEFYYTGTGDVGAAVADFNGDGMPDVALLNRGNGAFVSLMLNSTQPVSISPLNVNFGSVTVGSKKPETVILTNNQKTSLAITSITLGGTDASDFSAKSTCGTSRKAGWDCTITVTFTPTVTGARTATLSIKDAVGTQTVQLNGTGK
ncbi:MAG TPA: FG-GAP-like repeat-containing protein [Terriglobales bacterium]|nr:FG-GAP-like repeat-containing protein [Terriglobales bacterium]